MVCGTTSDAGKSHVVTALCRLLSRRGVRVAPFKAQNMANNSYVCPTGHEIGRAQGVQALAAGIDPEVVMNPVLLKPTGERTSQVVVMGEPIGHLSAAEYHERKPELLTTVLDALADLRRRFDVVVVEGAGSPTEINLLANDIVNLRIAHEAGLPAIVVGDIDRGGVFAALYGTVALLPDHYRKLVRGFVINKLRGDPALLLDGCEQLEAACGVPTLGVLPWIHDVALDAEDSLALDGRRPRPAGDGRARGDELDVAVIRFPRLSNFTDLDALSIEPGVGVRFVSSAAELGRPDLLVLPGSKATMADLAWFRERGFDRALSELVAEDRGSTVLGVCGGYQMLGSSVSDPHGIEADRPSDRPGLGLLDVRTAFVAAKVTRQRRGTALGEPIAGYEIHHGRTERGAGAAAWLQLDDAAGGEAEGAAAVTAGSGRTHIVGTAVHGLFESDAFRARFLTEVGRRAGKAFVPAGVSFAAARADQFDRLADLVEAHVDLDRLAEVLTEGAPGPSTAGVSTAGPSAAGPFPEADR